jgi:predicted Zn-dependent protease
MVKSDDVNAFALPGGHLIVFTGLIDFVENESELAGVIGHELAHIQLDHVMKKMGKEIGLSVLINMTSGGGNGEVVREALKTLTSTAFDRGLEKDADIKSVEYLSNAHIDYKGMSAFMNRLAREKENLGDHVTILSTHPASEDRAQYILAQGKKHSYEIKPVLSDSTWNAFKTYNKELHH